MKLYLLKVFIFVFVFIALFLPLSGLYISGINRLDKLKNEYFYSLTNNSVDVLFLGSSAVLTGISPPIIWDKYSITSFNRATSMQQSITAYFYLKESLEYQSPKYLVLDVQTLFNKSGLNINDISEPFLRSSIDSLKSSKIKEEAINGIIDESTGSLVNRLSYFIPYIRYYRNLNEAGYIGVIRYLSGETNSVKRCQMGGMIYTNSYEIKFPNNFMEPEVGFATYDRLSYKYFIKVLELCKDRGINVLLVAMPNVNWTYKEYNSVIEISKQFNVEYYDFNLLIDDIGIVASTHFFDDKHLNINGCIKASTYLGKILSEKYDLNKTSPNSCNDWYNALLEFNKLFEDYIY